MRNIRRARALKSLDRHLAIRYLSIPFPVTPVDKSEAFKQTT
jgi:hypothetical protein